MGMRSDKGRLEAACREDLSHMAKATGKSGLKSRGGILPRGS